MRSRVSVTGGDDGVRHDVLIEAGPGADLHTVIAAVRQAVGASGVAYTRDGEILTEGPWDASEALLPGARISFAKDEPPPEPPAVGASGWTLTITAGPDLHRRFGLDHSVVVGRGIDADIRLTDDEMSRLHFELRVVTNGVEIRDVGSTNGTEASGAIVDSQWRRLSAGETIVAGRTMALLEQRPGTPASLIPREQRLELVESARAISPRLPRQRIVWPPAPTSERRVRIPWVVFLLPLLFAVVMAVVRQSPDALLFGLLTPISLLGNWWYQRGEARGRGSEDRAKYERAVDRARTEVSDVITAQSNRLHVCFPDPEEAIDIGTRRLTRLWERQRDHDDFSAIRLGVGTRVADLEIAYPADEPGERPLLSDVPITIGLRSGSVVGVVGDDHQAQSLQRWVLAQLAVAHSPDSLAIALLGSPLREGQWSSARWLPHVAHDWLLGVDAGTSGAIAERLLRYPASEGASRRSGRPAAEPPRAVVILTHPAELRRSPSVARLLAEASDAGLAVICFADESRQLPPECRTIVDVHGDVARLADEEGTTEFRVEGISDASLDEVCRALAPIVEPDSGAQAGARLPDLVRLDDLLPALTRDPNAMRAAWGSGRDGSPIGVTPQGPFVLDLAAQGPHALVAGTTGSGKSEFLRTAVTSLAASEDPDSITFVFIDYKGDSAFRVLKELPHCVGFVTDLDDRGAERALISFKAEVRRRSELITVAARSDDIEGYRAFRQHNPDTQLPPLPRLVIMIDEFARLKQNMPEFISGLIEIAQVGRSLGMHLVMATQRPAGNINDQIRACVDLIVCLRTASESDSRDVMGSPDAAHLAKEVRGRAFIKVAGAAPVLTQTASSTWTASAADATVRAFTVPWFAPGPAEDSLDVGTGPVSGSREDSEAIRVVRLAREVWASSRGGQPHRPWLPPLPEVVPAGSLAMPDDSCSLRLGLMDVPQRQEQVTLSWPLASGHLAVVGTLRTGRTSTLRTLLADLAARTTPDDVHIHAIDGGGGLGVLAELPHTGVVVERGQTERLERLLDLLEAEISQRRSRYVAGNLGSISQQRDTGRATDPFLALAIDRWDVFVDADPRGELTARLARLMSDGTEVGLCVILTGDERFATSAVLAQRIRATLALRVSDVSAALVPGLSTRQLSTTSGDGRAVWSLTAQEVQIPILGADPATPGQTSEVVRIAQRLRAEAPSAARGHRPARIDPLPDVVSLTSTHDLPSVGEGPVICVGGNTLSAFRMRHAPSGAVVQVLGREPSTTALAALVARQILDAGNRVWWLGRSTLPGATVVGPEELNSLAESAGPEDLVIVADFDRLSPTALSSLAASGGPALMLISAPGQLQPPALSQLSSRVTTAVAFAPLNRFDLPPDLAARVDPGYRLDGPLGRALLVIPDQTLVVQVLTA